MIKVFWAFVKKEWYHIIRDKRTLLILFGMPVAQVLLFGYAISTEFKGAQIDVLDYAKDDSSNLLIHHLQSSGHFTLNTVLSSEQEMEKGFKEGTTKLVVVIPEDFDNALYNGQAIALQLITDGSDPNNANTLLQYFVVENPDHRTFLRLVFAPAIILAIFWDNRWFRGAMAFLIIALYLRFFLV